MTPNADYRVDARSLLAEVDWLRAMVRSLVVQDSDADDVAQDTLIAALARADRPREPRALLAKIARNFAARLPRSARRRRARERAAARTEALPSAAEHVEQVETQRAVVDAVLQLAEPYRSAVLLRFREGLGHAELATRMNVPLETARTRLKRGLAMLRQRLDREHRSTSAWALPVLGLTGSTDLLPAVPPAAVTGGLVWMTTHFKLTAALAVLIAGLALVWFGGSIESPPLPGAGGSDPAVAPSTAALDDAAEPAEDSNLRSAIETARAVPPAITLRGRLLAEESRAPLPAVPVTATDGPDFVRGRMPAEHSLGETAPDGTFEGTIPTASSRAVLLIARPDDRAPLMRTLARPASDTTVVDLGDILLAPGTRVRGIVTTATGEPVSATLLLPSGMLQFEDGAGGLLVQVREIGRADASGHFTLDERLLPTSRETYLVANTDAGIGWTTLDLLRKRHEAEVVIALRPVATLRARVVDGAGAAMRGVEVHAVPLDPPIRTRGAYPDLGSRSDVLTHFERETDPTGEAHFAALPIVSDDGRSRYEIRIDRIGYRRVRSEVSITPGETRAMTIELAAAPPTTVSGSIVDDDGTAIAGARVRLFAGTTRTTHTSEQGQFEFAAVDSRLPRVHFGISADGYVGFDGYRELEPSDGRARFDFVLERAVPLFGQVVDEAGAAISGAVVSFGGHRLPGDSDSAGEFRLATVPLGEHELVVYPPPPRGDFAVPVYRARVRATDSPIRVELRRNPESVRLIAELRERATGAPLDARSAQVFRLDQGPRGGADPEVDTRIGRLTADGLTPGRWTLRVHAAEGHRTEQEFDVEPGQREVHLTVEIGALARVSGRIDLSALPAEQRPGRLTLAQHSRGASWVAFDRHGRPTEPGPASVRGEHTVDLAITDRFRLVGIDPSAPISIRTSDDALAGVAIVRPEPGTDTDVVLRVEPAGHLVLDAPRPWPTVRVEVRRGDADWRDAGSFEDHSRERLATITLAAGSISWRLTWSEGGRRLRREGTATIAAGTATRVAVELRD